jgi:hypothetical protein
MYLEDSKRFIMSAKIENFDLALISRHEYIWNDQSNSYGSIGKATSQGYIAKLSRHKDKSFLLTLNGCRFCDRLGYYTCGRGSAQREVIAKISHSIRSFKKAGVDIKCLNLVIPRVSENRKRPIWCPRYLRITNPLLPMHADVNESLVLCTNLESSKYSNKLPEWSEKLDRLVLKFHGNRVLCASSKNILLHEPPPKLSTGTSPKNRSPKAKSPQKKISPMNHGNMSNSATLLRYNTTMYVDNRENKCHSDGKLKYYNRGMSDPPCHMFM